MNKSEMITKVAEKFECTKKDAEGYVEFILDTCAKAALEDGKVRIGTHRFERVERAERKGRNPKTGEELVIPAKTKIAYRNVGM